MNLTPQQRMEAKAQRRERSSGRRSSLQIAIPIHPKRARLLASVNPPPSRPPTPPPLYEDLPIPADPFAHSIRAEAGLRQLQQVTQAKPDKRSWWWTKKGITLIIVNMVVLGAILGGVLGAAYGINDGHSTPEIIFPSSQPQPSFPDSSTTSMLESVPFATTSTTTATGSQMPTVDTASALNATPGITVENGPRISSVNAPFLTG
ncbi:hypothetical protein D9756_007824 [Leucocoprinus leucothites]|uniref:Uncharacterized protein n=1 Tax=Leucocoprinus leucothites TaxID=201217 RepID=A0A8H5D485_9AGAR|nr:hypothetical protein D9756_007824 [Leucoagaricus leucothites]